METSTQPPVAAAVSAKPEVQNGVSIQKLTYKIGPFSLPAGTQAQAMQESPGTISFKADEPLWITSFESKIEDSSGGDIPAPLLNYAIFTNGGEQNPLCTEKQVANPFVAANSTVKKVDLPEKYGYAVLPEDVLEAKVILHNPTTQDFNNIYYVFTLTAVPMRTAKGFSDVAPLLLDVDPCDHAPIAVAPKEFVKKEANFKVPEDGLLMKAYGLLQDYGVEISLNAKNQPTPVWTVMAEQSQEHKIIDLPSFEDPAGIPLKAGDPISINIAYDNSSDNWRTDATGAVMVYIARAQEERKPLEKPSTVSAADAQAKLLVNSPN